MAGCTKLAIDDELIDKLWAVANPRSSIASRLGLDIGALASVDRLVEGLVEMVLGPMRSCRPASRLAEFLQRIGKLPHGSSDYQSAGSSKAATQRAGPLTGVSGASVRD